MPTAEEVYQQIITSAGIVPEFESLDTRERGRITRKSYNQGISKEDFLKEEARERQRMAQSIVQQTAEMVARGRIQRENDQQELERAKQATAKMVERAREDHDKRARLSYEETRRKQLEKEQQELEEQRKKIEERKKDPWAQPCWWTAWVSTQTTMDLLQQDGEIADYFLIMKYYAWTISSIHAVLSFVYFSLYYCVKKVARRVWTFLKRIWEILRQLWDFLYRHLKDIAELLWQSVKITLSPSVYSMMRVVFTLCYVLVMYNPALPGFWIITIIPLYVLRKFDRQKNYFAKVSWWTVDMAGVVAMIAYSANRAQYDDYIQIKLSDILKAMNVY